MEDNARSVENFNGDGGKILFCILDGFWGIKVSKYLQDYFSIYMKQILPFKEYYTDFGRLFKSIDEKIKKLNAPNSGSTATVVYIERNKEKRILFCANVGNSRYVLVNENGVMRLSYDDLINDPKEYNRIIKQRGIIVNNIINGRDMLSKSFGDWASKQNGIISAPHITKLEINNKDLFLIITSDGMGDVIKDEECKIFSEKYTNTLDICKNLVQESINRGSKDNIICYVIKI